MNQFIRKTGTVAGLGWCLSCGIGCVPSVFPMVVNKEKQEKPIVAPAVSKEPVKRIHPGQIDDANAAEMLQAIRKEIDQADIEPVNKP